MALLTKNNSGKFLLSTKYHQYSLPPPSHHGIRISPPQLETRTGPKTLVLDDIRFYFGQKAI